MSKPIVKDWMTPNPITISPHTTVTEAHNLMKTKQVRRLPVLDGKELVGILTFGDIREAKPSDANTLSIYELQYLLGRLTVEEIMTHSPLTISPEDSLKDAARLMVERKIGGLPVINGEALVGIITESDLCRFIIEEA